MWFLYTVVFADCYDSLFRKYKWFILTPLMMNFAVIILNLQNKFRGDFFFLPVFFAFFYMLFAGFISFRKAREADNKGEQREHIAMLMFQALPAIGAIIQISY